MRRIRKQDDCIVYRETPLMKWILLGGSGVVIPSLVILGFWGASVVIGLLSAFQFLTQAFRATATVVEIDPIKRIVRIRRRSALSQSFDVYAFEQLSGPLQVRPKAPIPRHRQKLVMDLKSGEKVVLASRSRWFGWVSEALGDPPIDDLAAMLNGAIPEFAARDDVRTLPVS